MDRVNKLLLVTSYDGSMFTLKKKEYSEIELLKQSKSLLSNPFLFNQRNNLPLLVHNLSHKLINNFIDLKTMILKPLGNEMISEYELKNCELRLLFSFYPKYSKDIKISNEIFEDFLTPTLYLRFINEIVQTISYLPHFSNEYDTIFSKLIIYLIFSTPKLCLLRTINDLRSNLFKYLKNELKFNDINLFDQIFNESLLNSFNYNLNIENKKPYKILSKYLHLTKDKFFENFLDKKNFKNNYKTFTFIHERASILSKNWVYNLDEIEDDPTNHFRQIQLRSLFIANSIYKIESSNNIKNNSLIFLTLNSTNNFDLSSILFIQFKFRNKYINFRLNNNTIELILPSLEKKHLKIRFKFINDPKNTIKEVLIEKLNLKTNINGDFFLKKQNIKIIYLISLEIKPKNEIINLNNYLFNEFSSSKDSIDFLIECTLSEWLKDLKISPPMKLFSTIIDFALKYSIPTSYIYFKFLTKFLQCWSSSGLFIDAFVNILLTCYIINEKLNIIENEKNSFQVALETLQHSIPKILINNFSKPELIEHSPITSLMIILSLFYDPLNITNYFSTIIQDSIVNIFEGIIQSLEWIPNIKEANPSTLSLYSLLPKTKNEPIIGENMLPKISFTSISLIETSKKLLLRTQKLTAYFTKETLPSLLNHQQSIRSDFASLSFQLAQCFTYLNPPPSENETYEFLGIYKQLWRLFGSYSFHSPKILFQPVIYRWISDLGPALIKWTSKAIELDDFSINVKSQKTSTSLIDLFTIFNDTFSFLDKLDLGQENHEDEIINSYISLCSSSIRLYITSLLDILHYHINLFTKIEKYKFPLFVNINRKTSLSQFFVIINDLTSLHSFWQEFITIFTKKHQIIQRYDDITNGLSNAIKTSIESLDREISRKIKYLIYPIICKKKKLFNKKTFEINEQQFNTIKELVLDLMIKSIEETKSINNFRIYQIIKSFLKGFENGLLYILIPFSLEKFKSNYLIQLIEIFEECFIEIFQLCNNKKYLNNLNEHCLILKWIFENYKKPFNDIISIFVEPSNIKLLYFKNLLLKSLIDDKKLIKKEIENLSKIKLLT